MQHKEKLSVSAGYKNEEEQIEGRKWEKCFAVRTKSRENVERL
jgi:hypothetical protein